MKVEQRIAIEKRIVRRTVNAFIDAGFELNIWEGEYRLPKATTNKATINKELMATDEDYMTVKKTHEDGFVTVGWVYFVYGNDGYDVICDYTTNLEAIIKPIEKYADKLRERSPV